MIYFLKKQKKSTLIPSIIAHVAILAITFTFSVKLMNKGTVLSNEVIEQEDKVLGEIDQNEVFDQSSLEQVQAETKTVTFLLLGYGGPGHDGGMLTDVIQLVHFDFEQQRVSMISIPRDLWVSLPNGKQAKVNQAFTLGDKSDLIQSGGQVAKEMAEIITGLEVDYFISIDFVGFQRLIGEVMKGIEVEVHQTLDDPWYPIKGEEVNPCEYTPEEVAELSATLSGFELEKQFECRYEHIHFDPGIVEMQGGDALKYVRSRHGSAGGDFSRSQRQQEVLVGMVNKLLSLEVLANVGEFFETANYTFHTDLDLSAVKYLAPAFQNIGQLERRNITISTTNVLTNGRSSGGQFILLPQAGMDQWAEVHQFVQQKIN